MKYYIDPALGTKEYFHIFNLTTGVWVETTFDPDNIQRLFSKDNELYCFDLYKIKNLLGGLPFVYDLQSLYSIQLKKVSIVDDLFDKVANEGYFSALERINAHMKSYKNTLINAKDFSLKKLIPPEVYMTFYHERLKAIKYLISKPINEQVLKFYVSDHTIQGILTLMSLYDKKALHMPEYKHEIAFKYNFFGAKNSRLSIRNHGVNFYNLPKEERSKFESLPNHLLVQFDYKSFQPRLALSLFGSAEVKEKLKSVEDIYSIFPGDREENKLELISWMFSNRKNPKFDSMLESLKKKRYEMWQQTKKQGYITNVFDRPLFFEDDEENVVFQNYISSVESDSILSVLTQIFLNLKDKKSSIITPFYDCVICSINYEELEEINVIKDTMEKYLYRHFEMHFPVTIKVGTNFGELQNFDSVESLKSIYKLI